MLDLVEIVRERMDTSPGVVSVSEQCSLYTNINHMYQSRCDNYYYRLQKLKKRHLIKVIFYNTLNFLGEAEDGAQT